MTRQGKMLFVSRGKIIAALFIACLLSCPLSGRAEEAPAEPKKEQATPQTPVQKLDDATARMTEGLGKNELLQFRAIEQSYRTIHAVEDVESSVRRAVEACGQKNPDLREKMDARFQSWKDALRPTIKEAYKKLDKMILLQDFSEPSGIRKYLKLFDAAVAYKNQGVESKPVTEPQACLKLEKSMDETEKSLSSLLIETLGLDAPLKTSTPQEPAPKS